ncbi:hypothetical protein MAR_013491 [Mya arenaria]|uniref:Uncharacterized protein n=1 Tax=Mya arenaria TaxID=6604 RepID=A0ABY7G023_MYAAR|nr:hypothetical protein MAR_013491 [Mya arenaria]
MSEVNQTDLGEYDVIVTTGAQPYLEASHPSRKITRYVRPCVDVGLKTSTPDRNDVITKEEAGLPTRSTVRQKRKTFEWHKNLVLCFSILVGFILGFAVCSVMWLTIDKLKQDTIVCELGDNNGDKDDVVTTHSSTNQVRFSSETTTSTTLSGSSSQRTSFESATTTEKTHFSSLSTTTASSPKATTEISSDKTTEYELPTNLQGGIVTSNVSRRLDGNASTARNIPTSEVNDTDMRVYDRMSTTGDQYNLGSNYTSPKYTSNIRPCLDVETSKPDKMTS